MKDELINSYYATMEHGYHDAFWNAMRGKGTGDSVIEKARIISSDTYLLPAKSASRFSAALKGNNLFRRNGTVLTETSGNPVLWLGDTDAVPEWIPEGQAIPVRDDGIGPKHAIRANKLGIITSMERDYVTDPIFDLESYLIGKFARMFGNAEEDACINGTGEAMPKGILHDTDGAETGITVSGDIAFDDVLGLYFSLDKRYRANGMWLMNDETALKLKKLKDQSGQYLWNQNSDTILGKPVHISEHMPSDGKPVAFGDLSYYCIIDRKPLSVRSLDETFFMQHKMGYLGVEYLDGLLVRPEAVKVLKVSQ